MSNKAESLSSVRKKVTHTHESISCSHHEAGHTIYALLHFMTIHSVRIFPDKKTKRIEGFTHYDSPNLNKIQDPILLAERVAAEVGLCYAGLVAEKYQYKLHSGSDKFPSFLDGSSKDLSEASELIKKHQLAPAGRKRYNYKKRAVRTATRELQQNWEAVTLVAHALFQKKRLNFSDLKTLLTKKTENKEFWKERFKAIANYYDKPGLEEEFKSMISL